jgi:hypothetical protein
MRPISILARTAILAASAAFATSALAADQPMTRAEERAYRAELEKERERLEQVLSRVTDRSEFASAIVAEGYRLAAVNADEPDYLEFEIVKDRASHEVRIEFDPSTRRVRDLDVDKNIWLADTTRRMLEDPSYVAAAPLAPSPGGGASDRPRIEDWANEKERLEKLLEGLEVGAIAAELERAGYQITSTNEQERDYIEYEVVRGDNSYEVQVEVDADTRRAEDVDVTSNLWRARSTREVQRDRR